MFTERLDLSFTKPTVISMCEEIIVVYKCHHEITRGPIPCLREPLSRQEKEDIKQNRARGESEPLPACDAGWPTPFLLRTNRLCSTCRDEKRQVMKHAKPPSEEWQRRYDWKWWREWKPNNGRLQPYEIWNIATWGRSIWEVSPGLPEDMIEY